ncbi:conjugal transfer protein TraB [Synergistales bacterium]|nr:conjugal transfer protein TraB [Synergistales bacterium]
MFAYYLAGSRGIVRGTYVFFSDGSYARAFLFWMASTTALAVPWAIMKTKATSKDSLVVQFCNLTAAICLSVIPPLGIIGWLNPMLAAGVFFRGWGISGIVSMLLIWSFFNYKKIPLRYIVLFAVIGVMATPRLTPMTHPDFVGVNTSLGRIASGSSDILNDDDRLLEVFADLEERKEAGELEAKNIVLPENICGRLRTAATEREWERRALRILGRGWQKEGRTMYLGAEFGTPEKGELKYDNCVFSVGTERINYKQKVPVPFSMYRPWDEDGANAYMFKPETVVMRNGTRMGVLVCYEQFLPWPWILMLSDGGDVNVVVCVANNWWGKETSLPTIQARSRLLWGVLIGVPVVSAENI